MTWSDEDRAFVVELYNQNNDSIISTQRAFRRLRKLGPNAPVPTAKTIGSWVRIFRATGTTLKKRSHGRPRTVRTPETVEAIRDSLAECPNISARKLASKLGLSARTLRRILQDEKRADDEDSHKAGEDEGSDEEIGD